MNIRATCPICNNSNYKVLYKRDFSVISEVVPFKQYDVCCCDRCGGIYAGNIQETMPIDTYYKEISKYETVDYGSDNITAIEYQNTAKYIEKNFQYDTKILDIGCGKGSLLNILKKQGFFYLAGIDPSKKNCQYINDELGILAVDGAIGKDQCNIELKSYDLLIAEGVLEHIIDIKGFLDSCKKYIKKAGYFLIVVPDIMDFYKLNDIYQQFSVEHVNYFSINSLKNLFKREGFSFVDSISVIDGGTLSLWKLGGDSSLGIEFDSAGYNAICMYIEKSRRLSERIARIMHRYSGKEIYIWGAGTHTAMLSQLGLLDSIVVKEVVDSNSNYTGKIVCGKRVKLPQKELFKDNPILISSQYAQASIKNIIVDDFHLDNEIITFY